MSPEPPIPAYYDRLERWSSVVRLVRARDRRAGLSVHRLLADPRRGGRPTATRVHDHVVDAVSGVARPTVLDAGCGAGGTMIDLAGRLGGRYVGVTLSPRQADTARRAIRQQGFEHSIEVRIQSYDEPPAGPFDLVVAIESLAHSVDPASSVRALAEVVAPGGALLVVDDMPMVTSPNRDLDLFKDGWACPVLPTRNDYRRLLEGAGLVVADDRDLTAECRPRTRARLALLDVLNRTMAALVPRSDWRALMRSHRAGLALERLYRDGAMQYRLLLAGRT